MSEQTILVFGATGKLGARLCWYLEQYAKQVNKRVTVIPSDIDPGNMRLVQQEIWQTYAGEHRAARPNLVINAHYQDTLDFLEADPQNAFTVNVIPAANIALAARAAEIPMIQISTDQVFRGTHGPYPVDAKPQPVNVYGLSMYYAEQAVQAYYPVKMRSGMNWSTGATILRLSWLHGPEIDTAPAMVLRPLAPQTERVYSDLKFTPAFVGEAAFLIARNIVQSPQTLARQIIHVAPKESASWHDLLKSHAEIEDAAYQKLPQARFVRHGSNLGLVPTTGWVLPADYHKGINEHILEYSTNKFTTYW